MARLDRQPAERLAIAGLIVQAISAAMAFFFGGYSGAASAKVLGWQALIGVPIWVICWVHLRQSRLAEEEGEEWERLQAERAAGGARGKLFEEDEIQAFTARNRLRLLEKYFEPAMSVVLALLLAAVVALTFMVRTIPQTQIQTGTALLSFTFVLATTFILFLIAVYASGMARQPAWRTLRPAGSFMMFTTLYGAATAVALALGHFGYVAPDHGIAYVMLCLMGVIAIETLLNFVLDFYRPRVEGVEQRPAYDSRLLSLIAQPGGILKTVASTLDYQFGFRVSETWFYRFVEQALAPLLLFQILTLYLLTSFVIIGAQQRGLVERFGRLREGAARFVEPGLTFKWPWPIERIYVFPANDVRVLTIGYEEQNEPATRLLWTEKHYDQEYEVMVATGDQGVSKGKDEVPVNLLIANMTVRYQIADVQKWYYRCAAPERLFSALCYREEARYMAGVKIFDLMGPGRLQASDELRTLMQDAADKSELGVRILSVGLEGIHPPLGQADLGALVAAKYQDKVNALQQKEIDILRADREAIETEYNAKSQAIGIKAVAQKDYSKTVNGSKSEAELFLVRLKAFGEASDVFKMRELLKVIQDTLGDTRKYVLGVKNLDRERWRLNLEDPSRLGFAGIGRFESEPAAATGKSTTTQSNQTKNP